VILRGWGVMNPTALKAAAKIGFPRTKIVGVWWSGAEEDVIPAGDAAKGYIAAAFNVSGSNYPGGQGDREVRLRQGKGEMEDKSRVGSIYYNAASFSASSLPRRSARPRKIWQGQSR